MSNKRTTTAHTCQFCGSPFYPLIAQGLMLGKGLYCSRRCAYRARPLVPTQERFFKYVPVATGDECQEWTGHRDADGYGDFHVPGRPEVSAHRYAWELANGRLVPHGMKVCHTCDNPSCVRTDHLFLGTTADNAADMVAKGRSLRGERHVMSKLTDDSVRELRTLRAAGMPFAQLGRRFGISTSQAFRVAARESWRHID